MKEKNNYIFMVGFPRSGTTLAQTIVMTDDEVFSFPETHYFTKAIRFRKAPEFLSNLWTSIYCYNWIKKNLGKNKLLYSFSRDELAKKFFYYLDDIAKSKGKSIVLEKTPAHLYHIEEIMRLIPNAKFIHVTRDCDGAVKSLMKASSQWKVKSDLNKTIARWLHDNFLSHCYLRRDNNFEMKFESLVSNREIVIDELNNAFDMHLTTTTNSELATKAKEVVCKDEIWKSNNLQGNRPKLSEPDTTEYSNLIESFMENKGINDKAN
ncbi:sulfotransferase family protein [Vibrio diabolicus]|uniref:sulfotransferase family protein n=1 Tax=Vibrio diabolicus TaxID=50719 RepID=UPI0024951CCE|nr:sulfotransferase [Vibrio diabolicus]